MNKLVTLIFLFILGVSNVANSANIIIDGGRYIIDTRLSLDGRSMRFEILAQTTGWVAFGISPSGGMEMADIIVGGYDGEPYLDVRPS